MTGEVGAVESLSLDSLMSDMAAQLDNRDDLKDAVAQAMERAALAPGAEYGELNDLDEILGLSQGDVESHGEVIQSKAEVTGAPESAATNEDKVQDVAHEMADLVAEMTVWQISWGVAQSAQKDLMHLLKSG